PATVGDDLERGAQKHPRVSRVRTALHPEAALPREQLGIVRAVSRQGGIPRRLVDVTQRHGASGKHPDTRSVVAVPSPEEVVLQTVVAAEFLVVAEQLEVAASRQQEGV